MCVAKYEAENGQIIIIKNLVHIRSLLLVKDYKYFKVSLFWCNSRPFSPRMAFYEKIQNKKL
jgi:hypothetical protein